MGEGRFMAVGLGAVFRLGRVAQLVRRLGGAIAFHLFAVFGIGGGFGGRAFAVLPGVLVLAIVILAFGIFAFGILVGGLVLIALIAQRQMIQHGAGQPREGLLVAQGARPACRDRRRPWPR